MNATDPVFPGINCTTGLTTLEAKIREMAIDVAMAISVTHATSKTIVVALARSEIHISRALTLLATDMLKEQEQLRQNPTEAEVTIALLRLQQDQLRKDLKEAVELLKDNNRILSSEDYDYSFKINDDFMEKLRTNHPELWSKEGSEG